MVSDGNPTSLFVASNNNIVAVVVVGQVLFAMVDKQVEHMKVAALVADMWTKRMAMMGMVK